MLLPRERTKLAEKIKRQAHAFAIGRAEHYEIETLGIQKATFLAFGRALENLSQKADFVLVDGFSFTGCPLPQKHIIKGDQKCLSIAAASIIAKVHRDQLMTDLAKDYPQYGFEKHKGYGTKQHLEALKRHGICQIHRRNFKPIKNDFLS